MISESPSSAVGCVPEAISPTPLPSTAARRSHSSSTASATELQTPVMSSSWLRCSSLNGVAGVNSVRFSGRLGGSALRSGRYRLLAVAEDAAGASSQVARAKFAITRR